MNDKKTNRVVVINPETQSVYEAYLPAENTLQEWYKTIGNGCELVQVVLSVYDNDARVENALLMDEEILLRPDNIKGAFILDGNIFFNIAIFSGADEEGETCDTTIDAYGLNKHVQFIPQEDALAHAEEIMNNRQPMIYFA